MSDLAPQITTLIPTYRRPQLLARAIRSVLRQSYPHFQICVFDNASGDETAEVVAEFAANDPRVKYHCHDANIGSYANVNYACSQVRTPFYNVLFDDDLLLPDFFETVMHGFEQHPDAMLSAAEAIYWNAPANRVNWATLYFWPREGYFGVPHEVPVKNIFCYPHFLGIMWRREVAEAVGPVQEFFYADLDFSLRACCRFPIVISKKPAGVLYAHEDSTGCAGGFDEYWPALTRIAENMAREVQTPPQVRQAVLEMIPANLQGFVTWLLVPYFRQGRFDDVARGIEVLRTVFGQRHRARVYDWINRSCRHYSWVHWFWKRVWNVHDWFNINMGVLRQFQLAFAQVARDAIAEYNVEPALPAQRSKYE